ncbi:MAG TPA: putative baseplate assembly protein, partial [Bacillota bacterium]|nr:putative baseplate assembly protein [Bacillota bacterium]
MNPATLKPPSLKPLTLEYQFKPNYYDLDYIFTYNHFFLKNHGTKVTLADKSSIMPFQPATDSAPGLYLAFDQDIGKLPVSLYLALSDSETVSNNRLSFCETGPKPGERSVQLRKVLNLEPGDRVELRNAQGETEQKLIVKINPGEQLIELDTPFSKDFSQAGSGIYRFDPPALTTWEYWNGRSWSGLNAEDRSQNMTRRDIVSFLVPDDITPRYLFESYRYWVRARLESGSEHNIPGISGVYVNAVWAHHVTTIRNELLGSGNGMPNQVFKLSSVPVLPGQEILVRETGLTELERQRVLAEEGADAVTEVRDAAGSLIELWVRWHEVENFMFSKPEDRHYRVDRNQGLIIFGDAVQGMIPPSGAGNIQCRRYQSGGGAEGNVPAGTLTKLRTSYPYIHGVANPEAGDGGANLENLVRALTRGPQAVRHRQRAISAADFEWLVREGSTKINKVKCLSTTSQIGFEPGWVTVIIVPESNEAAPYPSQELIARIEDELFAKVPADLLAASARVRLIGPDYIRVGALATVSFTSLGAAKVIEGRIQERLTRFFHPLTGGPEGEGWEFGRAVYASEVYQIIEETEGVDYVTDLTLLASVQSYTLKLQRGLQLEQSIPRGTGV